MKQTLTTLILIICINNLSYGKKIFPSDSFSDKINPVIELSLPTYFGKKKIYIDKNSNAYIDSAFSNNNLFDSNIHEQQLFLNDSFLNEVVFNENTFYKKLLMINCKFHKKLSFSDAILLNDGIFFGCKFSHGLDMSYSFINKYIDFENVAFNPANKTKLDFSFLQLGDSSKFNFNMTILPDTMDFSRIFTIPAEIDLSVCDFSRNTHDSNKILRRISHINLYKSYI